MSKAHAFLSASAAHRWIACPPSAKLQEKYEDKGSEYAAQGTDAHIWIPPRMRPSPTS